MDEEALTVAVRLRPLLAGEETKAEVASVENHRVILRDPKVYECHSRHAGTKTRLREFDFDLCFPPEATQAQVFEAVGVRAVSAFLTERRPASVIAYGQTGSGKTHTMLGTEEAPGLIPRICQAVLSCLSSFSISFYEIYNGRVRDLLVYEKEAPKVLRIRQHPIHGPYVQGLSRRPLRSEEDIRAVLEMAGRARSTGPTAWHSASSRSHAVASISWDGQDETGPELHLVDLAGSEKPQAKATPEQTKEAAFINRSLATLGIVILALSSQNEEERRFIPYRDSVLTWLLRNSLGGTAKTVMIGTISPSESCFSESLSTLRYAHRAKHIHSLPFTYATGRRRSSSLVDSLRQEVARLKALLANSVPTFIPPWPSGSVASWAR